MCRKQISGFGPLNNKVSTSNLQFATDVKKINKWDLNPTQKISLLWGDAKLIYPGQQICSILNAVRAGSVTVQKYLVNMFQQK